MDEFAGQINYLLKYSPDQQRIIVNYEAVMERYEQEKQSLYEQMVLEEQPLSDPVYVSEQRMMHHVRQSLGSIKKKMGILITLLFFLEGMLYTMDNTRRHLHGAACVEPFAQRRCHVGPRYWIGYFSPLSAASAGQ